MSPRYDYACECGTVVEEARGYEEDSIPCSSCSASAQRVPVYAEQFISGETVAKGKATRAGNITDPKGRTRVSVFQEAGQELADAHDRQEQREGRKLNFPDAYKAGLGEARRRGAKIRG
jgi:hypothetical protein